MSERLRAHRQRETPTANGRGLTGLGTTCTVSHVVTRVKGLLLACALYVSSPELRARPEVHVECFFEAGEAAEIGQDVALQGPLDGGAGDVRVAGDGALRWGTVGGEDAVEASCDDLGVAGGGGGVSGEGAVGPVAGDHVGPRGLVSSTARHGFRVSGESTPVDTCYVVDGSNRSHAIRSTGDTLWPGPSSSGASS